MKSILSFVAVTALLFATNVMAQERTSQGCFSSSTGMTLNGSVEFNSRGSCGDRCYDMGSLTFAMLNQDYCYCGDYLPPASTKVDSSKCNLPCPGYPSEMCGARNHWSVYITGLRPIVDNAPAAASDTPSSTASATSTPTSTPSVVTMGGETVVVTTGPQATSTAGTSDGGPSKAGIAAGVVVGFVAIAAIAGGLFLFMRKRKRQEIEEEYQRNAAVSSFIAGGKPPTSSGGASSFNDVRLDPAVMSQRRMSDGSIADNQDYSRRILKVTNA